MTDTCDLRFQRQGRLTGVSCPTHGGDRDGVWATYAPEKVHILAGRLLAVAENYSDVPECIRTFLRPLLGSEELLKV